MKHAGSAALDALEPLLTQLRALAPLKEKSRGVFYLRSRPFLHFHEDPTGLWADIRAPSATEFDRIRADGELGPATIIATVRAAIGPG